MTTDILCLCQQYDLRAMFGEGFEAYPDVRLLTPDEVEDPNAIKYVLAFRPLDDAFENLPKVELVCSVGAGVDGLLLHPGLRPEMKIIRMVNPEQAQMMAGFAAYYVVGHHRGMWDFPGFQADRDWRAGHCIETPSKFPVSVLGYGEMGQAIGKALGAMGYPVTGWAARPRRIGDVQVLAGQDGLASALKTARAVVCVLPLTDATRGLLNAQIFSQMRPDAIMIQIGRGAHLIEDDLIAALDRNQLARAALDVFATEPLPADSPLWSHPKVMVTPHIASDSDPAAIAVAVMGSINAHESGAPITGEVDRQRGY